MPAPQQAKDMIAFHDIALFAELDSRVKEDLVEIRDGLKATRLGNAVSAIDDAIESLQQMRERIVPTIPAREALR